MRASKNASSSYKLCRVYTRQSKGKEETFEVENNRERGLIYSHLDKQGIESSLHGRRYLIR